MPGIETRRPSHIDHSSIRHERHLPVRYTEWDLSPLFQGDNDPAIMREQIEIENKISAFVKKLEKRTDYTSNPKTLKVALDAYEHLPMKYEPVDEDFEDGASRPIFYLHLRKKQDNQNPEVKAQYETVLDRSRKAQKKLRPFYFTLAKIPQERHADLLSDPALSEYHHFLERTWAQGKHLLSEETEDALKKMHSLAYSKWIDLRESELLKEKRKVKTESGEKQEVNWVELASLQNSTDKSVRDEAGAAFNDIMMQKADIAVMELNAVLGYKKQIDELRGYDRPDKERHVNDDIESVVIDTMIEAVASRFDISQRYYRFKAALLGQTQLEYHERNVEYGSTQKYPYQKAIDITYTALSNLDPELGNIMQELIAKGRYDAFPQKGKRGGASCSGNQHLFTPTFVHLNHTESREDTGMVAHETGHALNNELSRQAQNDLNYGVSFTTAEVASTFIEDFALRELLKDTDDEQRLAIQMAKLNDEVSTVFRQVACYRFEQSLHQAYREEGYVSKEKIGKLFQEHMSSYMGDGVKQSPGSENWWVYWPHIRHYFYVYSYASGLLISKELQRQVRENPAFIKNIKEDFLSAGRSDSPKNIFAKLGIDISDKATWGKGLNEIDLLLQNTESLARKLGRIE